MNLLAPVQRLISLGFDAVESTGRRRQRRIDLRTTDLILGGRDRRKLISTTRDLTRNMAIAAWAVRTHCAHVAVHRFQCKSGDSGLDREVESLMGWWSRPENIDVSGRHSLDRLIYLAEHGRTTDGDTFFVKMSDGRVQLLDGPLVQTPTRDLPENFSPDGWVHGVRVTPSGRPLAYCICQREGNGFRYRTTLPARHVIHHAYWQQPSDARGVSPLAAAVTSFQDVAEATEYALAKAKVSQLFGLKLTRQGEEPVAPVDGEGEFGDRPPYTFEFGRGPQVLDLEPGDDADFLESRTPSTEFQAFCNQMVMAALKSLDLDYSLFDSSHTNYSGSRMALSIYKRSAAIKQAEVQNVLRRLTVWRLGLFIDDGELVLPRGMRLSDVKFEWRPGGWEPVDPLKQVKANVAALNAGLTSRHEICKSEGTDFYDIADQLAQESDYLRSRGIAPQGAATTDTPTDTDEEEDADALD